MGSSWRCFGITLWLPGYPGGSPLDFPGGIPPGSGSWFPVSSGDSPLGPPGGFGPPGLQDLKDHMTFHSCSLCFSLGPNLSRHEQVCNAASGCQTTAK